MQLVVTINLDNAAYEDEIRGDEVRGNLLYVVKQIDHGRTHGTVRDSNGNTVGQFRIGQRSDDLDVALSTFDEES
jgi:hypothetical protein